MLALAAACGLSTLCGFLLQHTESSVGPIALGFTLVALAVYIPAGYYLELALYRRRQRKRVSDDAERRKQGGR